MISPEIRKKIRHIQIYTRRLLSGSLVGDSRSALKGTGFEFDQIREYQLGDDIRFIDWKASARMNKVLVKQYIEERSRIVFLVVDVSRSSLFGSSDNSKQDVIAQIASVLALVSEYGKDHVGLILFSDEVELYIPPNRGSYHVHNIMQQMFSWQSKKKSTKITSAFKHLLQLKKKNAVVFLISDFIDEQLDEYLVQVSKMYDLVAVRCLDKNEKVLPAVGFLTVQDIETGDYIELDMRKKNNMVDTFLNQRVENQNKLLKKYGIDLLEVSPSKRDFICDVIRFFRKRMQY